MSSVSKLYLELVEHSIVSYIQHSMAIGLVQILHISNHSLKPIFVFFPFGIHVANSKQNQSSKQIPSKIQ